MDLKALASYFMDTSFDYWNESTQAWVLAWSVGYMAALDRFQTIYSRPIHLRTFGFPLETTLPASKTIRVNGTSEVYVLGQVRTDHSSGSQYQMLVAGRLCSGLGGGLAQVHRKVTQGTSPNLGPLVDTTVASHYADTELFATRRDAETDQDFDETYLVVLPAHCATVEDDFIHLGGRTLRVASVYTDSGFVVAKAEETADERVNFTYKSNTVTHTPGSGNRASSGGSDYTTTGIIRNYTVMDGGAGANKITFDVHVKKAHMGYTPDTTGKISYLSKVANVFDVFFDSKQSEWCLKCRI